MVGQLFLSGGGSLEESKAIDSFFLKRIPKNQRIAYIPVALANHTLYPQVSDWFEEFLSLHERKDIRFSVYRNLQEITSFKRYTAIYIGGGNTYFLWEQLQKFSVAEKIIEFHRQGGIVYGGSAGAIILGKSIREAPDENVTNLTSFEGCDLVNGYSIIPHAQVHSYPWFTKTTLYLPNTSGIIVNQESIGFVNTNQIKDPS